MIPLTRRPLRSTAVNQRFAETPGQLYRFSGTHGGMACESCHGSPHAEWPAKINTNDNITANQLQGHTGEIAECGVCHLQDLSPSLGGPHGLHNVNDARLAGPARRLHAAKSQLL